MKRKKQGANDIQQVACKKKGGNGRITKGEMHTPTRSERNGFLLMSGGDSHSETSLSLPF